MRKKRTYAGDVDTKGDPADLAERRSLDAEKAKAHDPEERKQQDAAAAIANASSQNGQT